MVSFFSTFISLVRKGVVQSDENVSFKQDVCFIGKVGLNNECKKIFFREPNRICYQNATLNSR